MWAAETKSNEKKAQNIMQRIEELPPELSAELFYKRLAEINKKMQDLKAQRLDLESQKRKTIDSGVSEVSIRARVEYAIKHLNEVPKETHRKVFENVIQFAEIHPTKIRLGVYGSGSNLKGSEFQAIEGSHTIEIGGKGGI